MYSRPHAAESQALSQRLYVRPSTGCIFRPVLCSIGFSERASDQGVSAAARWRRFFSSSLGGSVQRELGI
ncbi:hypothetical protein COCVIDRAFT_114439 [Bipolaris victoriae FI3]|uniref:Uncharacterized protein n=1 Tax=Bipolaris victoriae (strain FI3) TaxID=930091 RepID=W7EAY3_BIPV3|nr:hypothetical protein COCVIDRAFT_114439 [Bipolaris victoriae FI3]